MKEIFESSNDYIEGFEAGLSEIMMFMVENCEPQTRRELLDLQLKFNQKVINEHLQNRDKNKSKLKTA